MGVHEQAEALAAAGRVGDAIALLDRVGDGATLRIRALWTLTGQYVPRDLPAARALFARAAAAGDMTAIEVHTCFLANGAGGPPDWAAALAMLAARGDAAATRMRRLLGRMTLDGHGNPAKRPAGDAICTRPHVLLFRSLLTPDECDYLRDAALPLLEPSAVLDPRTGRAIRDSVRTSDTAAFPYVSEDPVVAALSRRFAAATNTQVGSGEPLQVLRYRPGQQFHPHSDALPGAGNPRIWTVLTWLNTEYDGGRTHFLTPDLQIRGGKGDAIAFRSVTTDGRADPAARHAGQVVTRGEKLLASRWIRARALSG